ncbi:MAG: glyoxylate/hydroxypyruvate reductase A [Mesorhizobium sp.]|uniref:NAD(P)-dependent oxidoreductase n=1 Tax=Mesorhizobium sp. M1D.F.Ca.ET.043.01.1.1 TaxID=2493669 RepID=UPI000F7501B3|nr:NAD(P)-dependent oxidoreductase [Mesorhizobium sp. M1D.F.Ca.ET.043.01.1.1]AZO74770.1 glyoxylate/hydroxypyruvate reductase A [Mesorhizobium sp. M1D.F.Ca.ET.043.01.1.1]TJW86796.1 MAG: glyoxylate/hydroxypyruvate reductase A [Mesorhizobium sp.]
MSGQPITVLMVNEYPDYIDADVWAAELKNRVPQLEFRLWPDVGNKGDIDIVLIDKGADSGFFDAMTGLRAVLYLGAGVDGIDLQSFPKSVALIRLATREQASEVAQYIVLRVLCQQRHVAEYVRQQASKVWHPIAPRKISETRIVVLGAGRIGGWAAKLFAELGYDTAVWSRQQKTLLGIQSYFGRAQLAEALIGRDYIICSLPLTGDTRGLLNSSAFGNMKRGAYLVNVARGAHVNEADLIRALDENQLSGACLDVFQHEPLEASSPLWNHPKVTITPHVASFWVDSGIDQAADLCGQVARGEPLSNRIDLELGY